MQTLTKVYERHDVARQVVNELEVANFPSSSITFLANKGVSDQYVDKGGCHRGRGRCRRRRSSWRRSRNAHRFGLTYDSWLGPVVAAGWLATTALGAVAGGVTGGIAGALIDADVPEVHAHVYSEAVRRGATLVSVRVEDNEVRLARAILDRHTSIDPVRQGEEYRKSGWQQFDPAASAHVPENIELERMRRAI